MKKRDKILIGIMLALNIINSVSLLLAYMFIPNKMVAFIICVIFCVETILFIIEIGKVGK
jgi:uncharacterized membrane protein